MYTMLSALFLFLISREIAHGPEPIEVKVAKPATAKAAEVK
jgi:hypothetical protein